MNPNFEIVDYLKKDLTAHHWLWYIVASDKLTLYGPVPKQSELENG